MAEAITRVLGGDRVVARSAGLSPLGWISEQTLAVLEVLGHPAGELSSKGLDEVELDDVDVLVSLLGDRGLDLVPSRVGTRREAWAIPDPFGEDDEMYLEVARELESRIRQLLSDSLEMELFPP